jgi:hypothetical protein
VKNSIVIPFNKLVYLIALLLPFYFSKAQTIGNYIGNGSFEDFSNCSNNNINDVKYWTAVDSLTPIVAVFSYCNGNVPTQYNTLYQLPRTGLTFVGSSFYQNNPGYSRVYVRNRMLSKLQTGETYCARFYVNIMNSSTYGVDGFGICFADNSIDSITKSTIPLTYLSPQVKCPDHVPITDTLGWVPVTGTFVANGTEKFAIIGIFEEDSQLDTVLINSTNLPLIFTDACIDDVSCVPIDLPADAGPDKSCIPGDSVFIGRKPDVGLDYACTWYKMPDMATPIATVAGIWVKTISTTTFVVKQQLWCSGIQRDTVVVVPNPLGLNDLESLRNSIGVYPNPANDVLNFEFRESKLIKRIRIQIINSVGQVIKEEEIRDEKTAIKTNDLPAGIYILNLKSGDGNFTKRFVVNR